MAEPAGGPRRTTKTRWCPLICPPTWRDRTLWASRSAGPAPALHCGAPSAWTRPLLSCSARRSTATPPETCRVPSRGEGAATGEEGGRPLGAGATVESVWRWISGRGEGRGRWEAEAWRCGRLCAGRVWRPAWGPGRARVCARTWRTRRAGEAEEEAGAVEGRCTLRTAPSTARL